jgi:putative endonuclease
MFYVYVLWSDKLQKRYVGITENIEKRIDEHNRGCNRFTKGGIPWILIHTEDYSSKSEALKRERFLKSGVGRAWLDSFLKN